MSKHRQLLEGQRLPQDFLDAIQEFIGSYVSPNFSVTMVGSPATTLRVAASTGNGQVAAAVNGKWRYITANADEAAPVGLTSNADNPLFITAYDNAFSTNPTPPPTDLDSTDYRFFLVVLPVGSTPSGTGSQTLWRQIGTAHWDGAKFTSVSLTISPVAGLASPAFTGVPTAPTPAITDNSQQIANTQFVREIVPAGLGPLPFAGSAAPAGWLLCDGSAVSRTTYGALFAAIGTTYGAGDGSTTFNLPDMRGRHPVGVDTGGVHLPVQHPALGATGGEETHLLTNPEMPVHSHGGATSAVSAGTPAGSVTVAGSGALTTAAETTDHTHAGATGVEGATHTHGITMSAVVLNFAAGASALTVMTNTGGVATGSESANHAHSFTSGGRSAAHTHSLADHTHTATFAGTAMGTHSHTISADGGTAGVTQAHNNMSPYLATNYIIKT